jgi:peptidyl-prolyl cis-trans isomerase B (cyclophilin B)
MFFPSSFVTGRGTFCCAAAVIVCALSNPAVEGQTTKKTVAVITTDQGEMLIEFWDDVAPKTVANFKKLATEKFYDGTAFHRIVAGFMIQGGDPLTRDESQKAKWGTGGPGYNIDAEFNDRSHVRGVISMARSSDPNSAGSQFFICLDDASFLDKKYTAFGKLVAGDKVLEALGKSEVQRSASGEVSSPVQRINVKSIRIEERDIPDSGQD